MPLPIILLNMEPVRGRDFSVQVPIVDADGDVAELEGFTSFIATIRLNLVVDLSNPSSVIGNLTVAESEGTPGTLDIVIPKAVLDTLLCGVIYFFDVIGYSASTAEVLVRGTVHVVATSSVVPAPS